MTDALKLQLVVQLFQSTSVEQGAEWLRWLDEGAVEPSPAWKRKVRLFGAAIGSHRTLYNKPLDELTVSFQRPGSSHPVKVTHVGWLWIKNRAVEMLKNFLAAQRQLTESRDDIVGYFTLNMSAIRSERFVQAIRRARNPYDFYNPHVSRSNKRNGPYSRRYRALFELEQLDDELLRRTVETGVLMEEGGEWPLCSGCTVNETGWVLTNAHCLRNDNIDEDITQLNIEFQLGRRKRDPVKSFLGIWKVTIFHDGRWGVLEAAHIDPTYDFALLKPLFISGAGPLPHTSLVRPARAGEPAVVVGNPMQDFGVTYPPLQHSAPGTIVALTPFERNDREELERRFRAEEPFNSTLAHSCFTLGGNSGSPLFSAAGELIGLHNAWWADEGPDGQPTRLNPARAGVDMRYVQEVLSELVPVASVLPLCESCERVASFACTCRTEFYCSTQCSERAWDSHHSDDCPTNYG